MSATCRSCGAEILWAVTENGKRMPVDAEPVPAGTILLRHLHVGEPPVAHITTREERETLDDALKSRYEQTGESPTLLLFVSHFATCPNAAQHRAPKEEPMATATAITAPRSKLASTRSRSTSATQTATAGVAIVENLQREELNPIEQAYAFQKAISGGTTIEGLADALNVSEQLVRDRVALLKLPETVQSKIGSGGLTLRAAALLPVLAFAGDAVLTRTAELIEAGRGADPWGDPITADDLEHDPAMVLENVLHELEDERPFLRHVRKGFAILPKEVDWPDPASVDVVGLDAKLKQIPLGYDPKTYRDYRQAACLFDQDDIDAARAYGCLVELKSGRHDVDAWVSDPAWLADRIEQKLDKAVKSHERKAKAAAKKAGAETNTDAEKEAADAKRAENAAARAEMLSARERNLTLGRALYKELHAPAISIDGMRAIAEFVVQYAGVTVCALSSTNRRPRWPRSSPKKNGEISKVKYLRTGAACRALVERRLVSAKTPEQIFGFLLQLLIAGRFSEVEGAPPAQRWGYIRGLDNYGQNRALVGLVEKLAEPVLPPAIVEQLREKRAQAKIERREQIEVEIGGIREGLATCPNCGNRGGFTRQADFVACDCTDDEIRAAIDSCPRCGEADCEASCSGFEPVAELDGSDDLTETDVDDE